MGLASKRHADCVLILIENYREGQIHPYLLDLWYTESGNQLDPGQEIADWKKLMKKHAFYKRLLKKLLLLCVFLIAMFLVSVWQKHGIYVPVLWLILAIAANFLGQKLETYKEQTEIAIKELELEVQKFIQWLEQLAWHAEVKGSIPELLKFTRREELARRVNLESRAEAAAK